MEKMRLDKFLSEQTALSRKDAKTAIRKGAVSVDGVPAKDGGQTVQPRQQVITLSGNRVAYKKFVYYMLNKPKGILSASNDRSRQTVVDLLRPAVTRADLFPVGRLDKDTTGLLLITDDGDFAHRVIAPKNGIPKCYRVTLDGDLTETMIEQFKTGIVLADGTVCKPALLKITAPQEAELTLFEGKYHEVKRMFGTVGLGVNKLHRLSIGSLYLPPDLCAGDYVELTENQVKSVEIFHPYTF